MGSLQVAGLMASPPPPQALGTRARLLPTRSTSTGVTARSLPCPLPRPGGNSLTLWL